MISMVRGIIAFPVTAMAAMHEDMHQRTQQENQVWQSGHQVGSVFGPEKISSGGDEGQKSQAWSRENLE